jgi:biopolymer transport protein ExbD
MHLRKAPSRRRTERITVNLASMIDVSFILLFYFLTATMLREEENRLSAGLQTISANAAAAGDFQSQIIEVRVVDGAAAYQLGTRVLRTRAELTEALDGLPRQAGVFVKVFESVPVGFAVAAVQTAHDAGFEQVTYVPAN